MRRGASCSALSRAARSERPPALSPTSASMRRRFGKGHRYHSVVCDLDRSTVEFVADERKRERLAAYYAQLTAEQQSALQAVAMDMWEPYIGAPRTGLPDGDAKIVFDRFHIM